MAVIVGTGDFRYEALEAGRSCPKGSGSPRLRCGGQLTGSRLRDDAEHRPSSDGVRADGSFCSSFGEGVFSQRTHGILIGPDDSVYCADDGTHTITKFTPDGKLLMTLGERNQPAPRWSGQPFNRPTHAAVSPNTGHLFVSDGYGNSRIHKYTATGSICCRGASRDRCGPVHPAAQHRSGRPGPGLCGRPRVPPGPGLRRGRYLHHDVQQHPSARRHDARPGWQHLHRRVERHAGRGRRAGPGSRVSIVSREGKLLARIGDPIEGEAAGPVHRAAWDRGGLEAATSTSAKCRSRSGAAS